MTGTQGGEPLHIEGMEEGPGGQRLYWQRWVPAAGEPKAVLLFVHGLCEHSSRYHSLVDSFASQGYVMWGFDYRGHGKSPGLQVHIDHFDDYLADLRAMFLLVRKTYPDLPHFFVGHSQGGLIALSYCLEFPAKPQGLVLSSPFLGVHPERKPKPFVYALARVLSVFWPRVRFPNGIDTKKVSRDPSVVEAFEKDPLVTRRVSARWYVSVLAALEKAHRNAPRLSIPTLVMYGGQDVIVDPSAPPRWAENAPKEYVEVKEWPGLYHQIYNEPEKQDVFEAMHRWLDAQLLA